MTWVSIANLIGPRGADGRDGETGPQGPVNVGLSQNEPITWDQAGGITFNLVDGSQQTVNLPIASAQSAGLQSPGSAYESGRRDITPRFSTVTSGSVYIERVGRIVTLNFDSVRFSNNGTVTLSGVVPAGFRSSETLIQTLMVESDGTSGQRISVTSAGNVSLYFYQSGKYVRGYFSYICAKTLPADLPGTAA